MAKADRQKYNFLTALVRQVKEAGRDGDEVYDEWCELLPKSDASEGADDRLDAHAQWLAALEARLEDLEQAIELIAGEEDDSDDDGVYDEDMRGDEPRVGGDSRESGRGPENLAGARERPSPRRSLRGGPVDRTGIKVRRS